MLPLLVPAPRLAGVLAAAALAACPAVAHAEAVGGAELRDLAARAAEDPGALERLRGVDAVDGRPVDVGAALGDARGAELRARLDVLAGPARAARDPARARAAARDVLAGSRFSPPEVPGPFRGVLRRIASWISPALDLVPALDDLLPGGRPVVWAIIVALVGALTALLAGRTLQRGTTGPRARSAPGAVPEDPDALERRAREAAARGDHELALRLGFRAGIARLDRRGVIELRPSLSTGEVARAVQRPAFDRTAARFDEVVYGGRPAAAGDVAAAQAAWAEALTGERAA